MRTSIATVCLSGTLEEKMLACARAGFDGIEIFEQDLMVSPMSPQEIRALADRLHLTLDLYQPFRDFEGVDEDTLAANLRRAEAKFELMNRLGIDTMLVCSNVGTATIDDDEVAAAQLRRLGETAQRFGIKLAYEALAWGRYVNTYRHAYRIVELADHPAVGTCLDSFHILSRGDDPAAIADLDPARIFFVQLADAPVLALDILSWSRHYRVFPGQGGFDLVGFMTHLVHSGYDGPVSLEIFNDTFRQSNVQRTAVDALRSLLWLQDRTAERLGDTAGRYPMKLASLPPAGAPSGMDFAEILTEDCESVAALLAQLGFTFVGQHRRKPVQLWTQGGARIIINGQRATGTPASISALGFQVASPATSVERSRRLRAAPVPRHSTADEAVLRGVIAPDGTEVFFADATADPAWAAEFGDGAGAGREPASCLVTGIDHVNLAQPWQAFDEAVLFYESALRLSTSPATEVPSPLGLVRSQVMRTDDGAVRLALNLVPQVLDANGHGDARHPYAEHVAFTSNDIVTLARQALEAGMEFLPIPENYYEDLAARFGLDEDLLGTLRSLQLLYDRDGNGAFLHFYTRTVGRLFLEVVQRLDGYDGYGAPNAPVRLASQFEHNRLRAR
ncbi:bifunctional sugar phosphate isomerase/epimerase/4-hydroxyphenylpyruvate dioxygenase family protein [Arthrobacter sp.]|uniref:bifunctional sugar phosphate isomerase/epimerase/4-hydroxyphenylpyruvate dioxygenase family protein n=1 Tax=Arthrobacter sp. TaxID=1667 RepID=UPI003A8E1B3B